MRWRDLTAPAHPVAANDNAEPVWNSLDEDRRAEIRPTENELIRATNGEVVPTIAGHELRLGDLVFNTDPVRRTVGRARGLLVEYGRTAKGRPLRPVERLRGVKGARRARRDVEDVDRYLGRGHSSAPVAENAEFLGGISAVKGSGGAGRTTAADCGHYNAEMELARTAEAAILRRRLGKHAEVLDAALTDSTAAEIGEAAGYSRSSAKKYGVRLIDAALKEFTKIAA